jgi:hypothetical protein
VLARVHVHDRPVQEPPELLELGCAEVERAHVDGGAEFAGEWCARLLAMAVLSLQEPSADRRFRHEAAAGSIAGRNRRYERYPLPRRQNPEPPVEFRSGDEARLKSRLAADGFYRTSFTVGATHEHR